MSVCTWKWFYDVIIFLFAWFIDAIQTMVFTYYTHLVLILSTSVKMMQSQLIRQITSVGQFRPKMSKYSITSGLMFTATLWVSDPIWLSNSQRNDLFWTDSVFDLLKKKPLKFFILKYFIQFKISKFDIVGSTNSGLTIWPLEEKPSWVVAFFPEGYLFQSLSFPYQLSFWKCQQ